MISVSVFLETLRMRLADLREEAGQGLVEYALIIALIAILAIVALQFLGGKVTTEFSNVGNSLT